MNSFSLGRDLLVEDCCRYFYVSRFKVEATLIEHSNVLKAAVIGVENDQGLTTTKAFVVLNEGAPVEDSA